MRESITEIAEHEVSGAAQLRMLITALSAGNFIGVFSILMVQGGYFTTKESIELTAFVGGSAFAIHLLCSRLPAIARGLLWVDRRVHA